VSVCQPYTLNTRSEEQNAVFYSYLARFCEYMKLEYVRVHVICRVNQAEYAIRFPMAAPQEYVNTYLIRRVSTQSCVTSLGEVRRGVRDALSRGGLRVKPI